MDPAYSKGKYKKFSSVSKCRWLRVTSLTVATLVGTSTLAAAQGTDGEFETMAAAIALGFGGQFAELKNPDDPRRMRIVSEVDALGMVTVEFCGEEGRVELHQSSFDSVNIDCKNRKTGSFATLGSDLAGIPIFTAAYDEVGSVISNSPPTEAGVMTSVRLSNPDWRGTELQIQLDTYDAFISFGRNGEPALVLGAEKTKALADAVSGKR